MSTNFNMDENPINFKLSKKSILFISFIGVIILIIIFWNQVTTNVGAGEAGVLFRKFGGGVYKEKTYGEGLHFILPWNSMSIYKVRQQELFEKMSVLSSNGLEITLEVSAWYYPEYAKLPLLHKEKGMNYLEDVIKPALRSATRSVIGRYTPEEIYSTKRDAIQDEIFTESKDILNKQYVTLKETLVRDISLPPSIKNAIENKLRQEQEALEYEFKLQKESKEAERIGIEAKGKADANRILNSSLTDKILRDKGIEATIKLSNSSNSKIIVIGSGKEGLPIILSDK